MRMPFLVIIITYTIAIVGISFIIQGTDTKWKSLSECQYFDAFYFVTYTATTIGFGEIPLCILHILKEFGLLFTIYLTVLGWFYGIGSLVSLLQDKAFLQEIEKARFLKQIRNLDEKVYYYFRLQSNYKKNHYKKQ